MNGPYRTFLVSLAAFLGVAVLTACSPQVPKTPTNSAPVATVGRPDPSAASSTPAFPPAPSPSQPTSVPLATSSLNADQWTPERKAELAAAVRDTVAHLQGLEGRGSMSETAGDNPPQRYHIEIDYVFPDSWYARMFTSDGTAINEQKCLNGGCYSRIGAASPWNLEYYHSSSNEIARLSDLTKTIEEGEPSSVGNAASGPCQWFRSTDNGGNEESAVCVDLQSKLIVLERLDYVYKYEDGRLNQAHHHEIEYRPNSNIAKLADPVPHGITTGRENFYLTHIWTGTEAEAKLKEMRKSRNGWKTAVVELVVESTPTGNWFWLDLGNPLLVDSQGYQRSLTPNVDKFAAAADLSPHLYPPGFRLVRQYWTEIPAAFDVQEVWLKAFVNSGDASIFNNSTSRKDVAPSDATVILDRFNVMPSLQVPFAQMSANVNFVQDEWSVSFPRDRDMIIRSPQMFSKDGLIYIELAVDVTNTGGEDAGLSSDNVAGVLIDSLGQYHYYYTGATIIDKGSLIPPGSSASYRVRLQPGFLADAAPELDKPMWLVIDVTGLNRYSFQRAVFEFPAYRR